MKFFLFTGFLVFKISWKHRIFTSMQAFCLLAQNRFENWLEFDCRFVGKQCTLLFSGSVAFNQCNAGGCWEKETVEREMEGESESMISPSACFSRVSCRSSDPFVMLSHGEIWLGSLPSSQNWHGWSKRWGEVLQLIVNGPHHQHCHYQERVAICSGSPYLTWLSSAFVHREQMNVVSSHRVCGPHGWREMRLLGFIVSPTQLVVNEKEWMTDTVNGS